jgi:peptidoglycan/LPS O-acetylase OafA/YrhL
MLTLPHWQIDFFLAGIALRLAQEARGAPDERPVLAMLALPVLAAAYVMASACLAGLSDNRAMGNFWHAGPSLLLALVLAVAMLGAPALATGGLRRWLAARPLRWVGALSYSLYIVHVVVIDAGDPLWRAIGIAWAGAPDVVFALLLALSMFASLFAALGLFVLAERPAVVARRLLGRYDRG